ncbi:glycosyltransferase family 32 protein [Acidovorax carolinensis]|nr:capsular polysaccharide synthesis protein [Acidovorax carolinensis]
MKRIPASLFKWALRCVRPRQRTSYAMPAPSIYQGSTAAAVTVQGDIPAILWTYWNHPEPDAFVRQCLQSWQRHCPSYAIRLVHPGNLTEYVPPGDLPEGFAALHPTKQSDWLRLYLVHRFGGYWLDATIVLTRPPNWLDALRQQHGAGFAGFYLGGFTHDPACPVVESWAFGAPAGEQFVKAWQREFHHALIEAGPDAYLARLRQQADGGAAVLQGIADPAYLLIHVAAQQVLRRANGFKLVLLRAEDTAFFYQQALWWKWYLLYPRLCLVPDAAQPAPLIKLRGGERRHFTQMIDQHGEPVPGSLWQRACTGASAVQ